MYAVVQDSGRQYIVSPGQTIDLDIRDLPEDAETFTFDHVLMLGEGAEARIGTPTVDGARVEARIDGNIKGPKIDVVKLRRRKGYRRKTGHRQRYLRVTITEITDGRNTWKIDLPETAPEPESEPQPQDTEPSASAAPSPPEPTPDADQ